MFVIHSFLLLSSNSIVWVYHNLSIFLLGLYIIAKVASMNKAAVNILACFFFFFGAYTHSFLLSIYLRMKSQDHRVGLQVALVDITSFPK